MTLPLTPPSLPLQDTVISVAVRDGFDVVQALTAGSVAATFLGVLLVVASGLFMVRRWARALERARERLSADPGVESLRRTAENIESISQTLHGEVAKLSESVSLLSERLTQASDRMEERIEEFNAFMEVVQNEAEGAFVDGAATARGVRASLGSLTSPDRTQSASAPIDSASRRPSQPEDEL